MIALSALAGVLAFPALAAEDMAPSVKSEILFSIRDARGKLEQLAEATPAKKYAWRPAAGVRSTGEVFLHVAAANYGIPTFWGIAPPEGFAFDGFEQSMTAKGDIQKSLAKSFDHMEKSIENADDAALTKRIKLFGETDTTVRGAYLLLLSHAHEHLGQAIAYARSNGVVPPWTAAQQAEIEAAKAEAKKKADSGQHGDHKH